MGFFDRFKKKPKAVPKEEKVVRAPKAPEKTAKQIATENNEPYVTIVSMDIDSDNLHQGAFELDWNEIFIARLVKAGYMRKKEDTDRDIIDRWFQDVCRNVVLEIYDQQQADPTNRDLRPINTKDLGNGRTEVS